MGLGQHKAGDSGVVYTNPSVPTDAFFSGTSPCGNVVFIYNGNSIQEPEQVLVLVAVSMDDRNQTQVRVDILCSISRKKSKDLSRYLGMRHN